jgi:Ca-activated chloride channel homolog
MLNAGAWLVTRPNLAQVLAAPLVLLLGLLLASCGDQGPAEFSIVSGSENKILEPIVQEFCRSKSVTCKLTYQGSLDIGLALKNKDQAFDAVWPASSLWIDMYDTARRVKHVQSIAQTPVILGVRKSKAEQLGWVGKPVAMGDVLTAVTSGRLRYIMTSATQSNSGASAYLAMLATALGDPQIIERKDLEDPALRDRVKSLLKGVERSAGSSGWLGELYLERARSGQPFDAMWNYEAVLKETNDALTQMGKETLYAIYPADGVVMADSPLGFVARGNQPDVEKFFLELQAFLATRPVQLRIAATGRRVPLSDVTGTPEPQWNFDPGRRISAIRPSEREVIEQALVIYQEALRRPSQTVLCLDFSGSMQGAGEPALKEAVEFLLSPAKSSEVLIQWTPQDRITVIPFNDTVLDVFETGGTAKDQATLLAKVRRFYASGGTDMYGCAVEGLRRMAAAAKGDFLPALIIMTDGRSEGSLSDFEAEWRRNGAGVPVFGVTFGDADRSQLETIATMTGGRVFNGTKDLSGAFRATRGYN